MNGMTDQVRDEVEERRDAYLAKASKAAWLRIAAGDHDLAAHQGVANKDKP